MNYGHGYQANLVRPLDIVDNSATGRQSPANKGDWISPMHFPDTPEYVLTR